MAELQQQEIRRLLAERNEARAARDTAIREMTEYARKAGEIEGRLRASEWPGVVDGWRERAERAEAERDHLRTMLRDVIAGLDAEYGRRTVDANWPAARALLATTSPATGAEGGEDGDE